MKKRFLLLTILFLNFQSLATDGELFFKINQSGYWQLKIQTIQNEKYYDCNFNIVSEGTVLDFTFTGPNYTKFPGNKVVADHCCDMVGEGSLDDQNNRYTSYYGKYLVTFDWGMGQTIYMIMDFRDCNYFKNPEIYSSSDLYFKIENNQFIETNSYLSDDYGNYTNQLYEIWEDFIDEPPKIQATGCFLKDIVVRNLVEGNDFGSLTINDSQFASGQVVTGITQGYDNIFGTYTTLVNNNYKFRIWNRS